MASKRARTVRVAGRSARSKASAKGVRGSAPGRIKRRGAARASAAGRSTASRRWSAKVMEKSDAMDLEKGVFKKRTPRQVALSLKRSAESSRRRKSPPFRSAMSMLNFEINRGGRNLSAERKRVLIAAKDELRKVFHRDPAH